jgi:quinol monooxygenase YgiN
MIYVIVTLELKPGKREEFLAEFHRNMTRVRTEKGCIEYGPAVDLKTDIKAQMPYRENTVTILEKWESLSALQAHMATPQMAEYQARVKDLLASRSLQILEPK